MNKTKKRNDSVLQENQSTKSNSNKQATKNCGLFNCSNQTFHFQIKPRKNWNVDLALPTTFRAQAQFGIGDQNLSTYSEVTQKPK